MIRANHHHDNINDGRTIFSGRPGAWICRRANCVVRASTKEEGVRRLDIELRGCCRDCGTLGEVTGHHDCSYPSGQ